MLFEFVLGVFTIFQEKSPFVNSFVDGKALLFP
jgi:hypothetical protein